MAHTIDDYKAKAYDVFMNELINENSPNSIFNPNNYNYWRIGTVYDTLLDYMQYAVADRKISLATAKSINKRVIQSYVDQGCWYDDYCWWVIALMKSRTYSHLFDPEDIQTCTGIINDAWAIISKGKTGIPYSGGVFDTFAVCDKTYFSGVKPLYEGGTWQYDIYLTRNPAMPCDRENNNPIPIDGYPYPPALGPYQLGVINGLCMVMTQRMSNLKMISPQAANNQYNFIKNWTSPSLKDDMNLLNPFDSGGEYGLIRERVSRYLDASVPVTDYDPSYPSWAGDQGNFIGGLYDYYLVNKDPYCLTLIEKILVGVKEKMTMQFTHTVNGTPTSYTAIYNWSGGQDQKYNPDGPMGTDAGDYGSGLGIFMRYLYYCCQDNNLKFIITRDARYLQLIRETANASYDDAYPHVDLEVGIFRQFNRLATLLAAIKVFER